MLGRKTCLQDISPEPIVHSESFINCKNPMNQSVEKLGKRPGEKKRGGSRVVYIINILGE